MGVIGIGCNDPSSDDSIRSSLYLVQEHLTGGSLKKLALEQSINYQAHGLNTATILGWCIDIASVLAHLHEECTPPIVHRDLKLENIMLTQRECMLALCSPCVATQSCTVK